MGSFILNGYQGSPAEWDVAIFKGNYSQDFWKAVASDTAFLGLDMYLRKLLLPIIKNRSSDMFKDSTAVKTKMFSASIQDSWAHIRGCFATSNCNGRQRWLQKRPFKWVLTAVTIFGVHATLCETLYVQSSYRRPKSLKVLLEYQHPQILQCIPSPNKAQPKAMLNETHCWERVANI